MSATVKLGKPIKYAGATITEITFREPCYRDVKALGVPGMSGDEAKSFDELMHYVERLSGLDPQAIELLSFQDSLACVQAVVPFFATAEAT